MYAMAKERRPPEIANVTLSSTGAVYRYPSQSTPDKLYMTTIQIEPEVIVSCSCPREEFRKAGSERCNHVKDAMAHFAMYDVARICLSIDKERITT